MGYQKKGLMTIPEAILLGIIYVTLGVMFFIRIREKQEVEFEKQKLEKLYHMVLALARYAKIPASTMSWFVQDRNANINYFKDVLENARPKETTKKS